MAYKICESIREANLLQQEGRIMEAASAYAWLLFKYPQLFKSNIIGFENSLRSLSASKRPEWTGCTVDIHKLSNNNEDVQQALRQLKNSKFASSCLLACNNPAVAIHCDATAVSFTELCTILIHRVLWGSKIVIHGVSLDRASTQQDKYLRLNVSQIWPRQTPDNESASDTLKGIILDHMNLCHTSNDYDLPTKNHKDELALVGPPSKHEFKALQKIPAQIQSQVSENIDLTKTIERLFEWRESLQKPSNTNDDPDNSLSDNPLSNDGAKAAMNLFSAEFYANTNPDLDEDTDLLAHYMNHGWKEDRDPSQFFSTSKYLEVYPDVKNAGVNPLVHYLEHGHDRQLFPSDHFTSKRSSYQQAIDLSLIRAPELLSASKQKVAILLHAHYAETVVAFFKRVSTYDIDFDILITTTSDGVTEIATDLANQNKAKRRVVVKQVNNRGRDINAFINGLSKEYSNYDVIGKIHSKKSPHLKHFGEKWGDYLMNEMIGSEDTIKRISYLFDKSPNIGIASPIPFKGTNNTDWAGNLSIAENIVRQISQDDADQLRRTELNYPSGTVFWFRPNSLTRLYEAFSAEDFPEEPLGEDGTIAHAIERLIPYYASLNGFGSVMYKRSESIIDLSVESRIRDFLINKDRGMVTRRYILFSHDASNTGAPRTAMGIHKRLNQAKDTECMVILLGGGPLIDRFEENGPTLMLQRGICLDILTDLLRITNDVTVLCNTVVTAEAGYVAGNQGHHVISLVHEFASAGHWSKEQFIAAQQSDVIVFPGASVLRDSVKYTGQRPSGSLCLRPQGLYDDNFPRVKEEVASRIVREEFGLDQSTIIVLGCGRIEKRKGFDMFIDTASLVLSGSSNKLGPPVVFLWVGGISETERDYFEAQLQRIMHSALLSEKVFLVGEVAYTDKYFAASDIFYLSSRFDPFPGVVLEAMASSMPIVSFAEATDVSTAYISECGGYSIGEFNVNSASDIIQELASNKILRLDLGNFAAKRIQSSYTFRKYVSDLLPLIDADGDRKNSMVQNSQKDASCNFSIVVPAYKTPVLFLQQMIDSVLGQTYPNLELIIAATNLTPEAIYLLEYYANYDSRVRVLFLKENLGIAGNTNAALASARGSYVGFLDHDDLLHKKCLQTIVDALAISNADFIYTDEDKVDMSGSHFHGPVRKPNFDISRLETHNYITHFTVCRRELVETVGGIHSEFDGAQDYDFILRAVDAAKTIHHIPSVLYHWRVSDESTASGNSAAKPYAIEAGRKALEQHLTRQGRENEIAISTSQPFVYSVIPCDEVSQ